jgi:phenylalanyl-tRNA synthetase alpha chain
MNIDDILKKLIEDLETSSNRNAVENIRLQYLGKSGFISSEMKKLASLAGDEKIEFAKKINQLKDQATDLIKNKISLVNQAEINQKLNSEYLDVSLNPRSSSHGKIHPITQATEELIQIFGDLGFDIEEGPSIEDSWHNFTALNMDENHPARQMHDTFYLNSSNLAEAKLLRTHTSPVQIRSISKSKPPIRFIAPGRTYRSDSDQTHTPMFHQIEAVFIDKDVNMGHLKYVIGHVMKAFFEKDVEILFRPSFFPFTEPSAEIDIRIPGSKNWLEVAGSGMIHPNVLRNVSIDPEEYKGFAFGMGIDRLAMLKYNIKDLRKFFDGDVSWLNYYSFDALDIPNLVRGLTK